MKRSRALLALTAIVTASLIGVASPASATTAVARDTQGDVWLSRVDIVSQGASYGSTGFTLAIGAARPVNPSIWPDSTGVIWTLDRDNNGSEDYKAFLLMNTASLQDMAGNELCSGIVGYDGTLVFASFGASCIGNAAGFSIARTFWTDLDYNDAYDFGPRCCSVIRDSDAPPPPPPPPTTTTTTTPPTTTTTQPEPDPTFIPAASNGDGYWMLTGQGDVYAFGAAPHHGNELATTVTRTHIEPSRSGNGYWILAESGAVHAKGDAQWWGSALNGLAKGETAESLSRTPTGNGYWIFTNRGRVFAYGDAQHFGDMSGVALNGSVLGSVATPTGGGYWMVASDGGIFSFGDAVFHGSTGDRKLNKPVMAMAPAPNGAGYWLVASDGGIFAFDVPFYGSMGGTPLNKPISGMVPGAAGYMMVGQDGGIFSFGSVAFHGSLGAYPPASPVVSVALRP